jgi:hypothetical protein
MLEKWAIRAKYVSEFVGISKPTLQPKSAHSGSWRRPRPPFLTSALTPRSSGSLTSL